VLLNYELQNQKQFDVNCKSTQKNVKKTSLITLTYSLLNLSFNIPKITYPTVPNNPVLWN